MGQLGVLRTTLACGLGLAAEGCGVVQLLREQWWCASALHGVAVLSLGWVAARAATANALGAGTAVALIAFSLPGVGCAGLVLSLLPSWCGRLGPEADVVVELETPAFGDELARPHASCDASPVEEVLLGSASLERRVAAVMALRRMDAKRAVPLLRLSLGDDAEDVRLLAYAILERREKELRADIAAGLSQLAAQPLTDDRLASATLLQRLAEAHWELVRGEYVQGDAETQNLQASARHAQAAFAARPTGTLALLLARISLRRGQAEHAVGYLATAQASGVSRAVCVPLLAEAAFLQRRYERIPELWSGVSGWALQRPGVLEVADFWRGGEA